MKRNIFFDKLENYLDYNDLIRTNKEYKEFVKQNLDKVKVREYFNSEFIDK